QLAAGSMTSAVEVLMGVSSFPGLGFRFISTTQIHPLFTFYTTTLTLPEFFVPAIVLDENSRVCFHKPMMQAADRTVSRARGCARSPV
ncbi:MAG TPA: hypothetical protein VN836_10955, partial [Verrucomicrobiae bacterium]|nr:hypothetical protein [Verrucomicrobiae bacterium]